MDVIIKREKLEELEEKANKLDCGMSYSVIEKNILYGRYISIDSQSVKTYNGTKSEAILHEIIRTQKQTIDTLNEIIELNNRSLWKRMFG